MNGLLARSASPDQGVLAQSYRSHILGVFSRAAHTAEKAASFFTGDKQLFIDTVKSAALFHDLGKLNPENQAVLQREKRQRHLPVNHVDAGTAHLMQLQKMEAALLTQGHHRGLCSIPQEAAKEKKELFLRDTEIYEKINQKLPEYLQIHEEITAIRINASESNRSNGTGLTRRLAFSCLVDADHGDAAVHCEEEKDLGISDHRWEKRLESLKSYVKNLDPSAQRYRQRQDIFYSCLKANEDVPIYACDSPVGSGKTMAVMAHLLKTAVARRHKPRHIFVVLPYTNIIKQSVDEYRKAIILPGEDPQETVVEHHHQADFSGLESRQLTTLWKAPIIVTTAVQFFETLSSNMPGRLRKLHELPGSAIFLDEAHAVMPSWLWPQAWLWLKKLTDEWSCNFVLASGSLVKFWENERIINPPERLPDLVEQDVRQRSLGVEERRVVYKTIDQPLNRHDLVDLIQSEEGPRLVIMNTVQSAAVLAYEMQKNGAKVLHLSTALTPKDRELIIKRIEERLNGIKKNWTLIATSCVEAGMDFSFRTAFRESCSAASLIQTGGRVNRHSKTKHAKVFDFRTRDNLLNLHPAFTTSRKVLGDLFKEGLFERDTPSAVVTEAMKREILSDFNVKTEELMKNERNCDYPEVARLFNIINADTRLVVIDQNIINSLESYQKVKHIDLINNSVQVRSTRINQLPLVPVKRHDELYKWVGGSDGSTGYDKDFLGYMRILLPLIYSKEEPLVV